MTDVEMAVGQGVEVNKHQDWDGVWVRCRGRRDLQPTAEMAFGRRAWADGRGCVAAWHSRARRWGQCGGGGDGRRCSTLCGSRWGRCGGGGLMAMGIRGNAMVD
jgi:hypothetical protein